MSNETATPETAIDPAGRAMSELLSATEELINAADEFERGCAIHDARVLSLMNGAEFSDDEIDEIDVEKILGESRLCNAVKRLREVNGR
jgi:hypothetical protein